jgi:hypothetical protein
VVDSIKNLEGEKVLLTFGNKDFQDLKVKSIFFDTVFDKVFLTDEKKILFLQDFVNENPGREIIFINDNYNKRFNENTEIKKSIPKIQVIEVDNYQLDRNIDIKSIFKNL